MLVRINSSAKKPACLQITLVHHQYLLLYNFLRIKLQPSPSSYSSVPFIRSSRFKLRRCGLFTCFWDNGEADKEVWEEFGLNVVRNVFFTGFTGDVNGFNESSNAIWRASVRCSVLGETPDLLRLRTWLLVILHHLTSSFAPVVTATTTRGRHLRVNMKISVILSRCIGYQTFFWELARNKLV